MRALQVQIQTRISEEMKEALEAESKARKVSQGAIIDEALAMLFSPDPQKETKLDSILQTLQDMQEHLLGLGESYARLQSIEQGNVPSQQAHNPLAFYAGLPTFASEEAISPQEEPSERDHMPSRKSRHRLLRRLFMKG